MKKVLLQRAYTVDDVWRLANGLDSKQDRCRLTKADLIAHTSPGDAPGGIAGRPLPAVGQTAETV